MGLEVSFDVEAVVLGGEATTGGAILILLAEVDVGRLVESFDCWGALVKKDGIIDGVGGSADVVDDVLNGKVNPGIVAEANEVVIILDFSIAIDGKTGFLCAYCESPISIDVFGALLLLIPCKMRK